MKQCIPCATLWLDACAPFYNFYSEKSQSAFDPEPQRRRIDGPRSSYAYAEITAIVRSADCTQHTYGKQVSAQVREMRRLASSSYHHAGVPVVSCDS